MDRSIEVDVSALLQQQRQNTLFQSPALSGGTIAEGLASRFTGGSVSGGLATGSYAHSALLRAFAVYPGIGRETSSKADVDLDVVIAVPDVQFRALFERLHRFLSEAAQKPPEQGLGTFAMRRTGTVKALTKLRDIWGLTDEQLSVLLGLSSVQQWLAVLEGHRPLDRTVDLVDRVRTLTRIDGLLYGLYMNDEGVRKWLTHNVEELGSSPIYYMLRGNLRHLDTVADYIQGLTDSVPTVA